MRKLVIAFFAVIMVFAAVRMPATAANYNGLLLDGKPFRATLYDARGGYFGIVFFVRDEARALLSTGDSLMIVLADTEIMNPAYIPGHTLDGHFWRISIDDATFIFQTQIAPMLGFDPVLGWPNGPGTPFGFSPGPPLFFPPPHIGGGRRGGGG